MIHRFKEKTVYGGETIFGGCGTLERLKVTVVKRTKGWIYYREQFNPKLLKIRRAYAGGWGDCFNDKRDDFNAYCVENGIEPF